MLNAIWWLVTAEVIGLAAFPLAYYLLPRIRDRGYTISKPLGILVVGYASWILSRLHIVPSVRLTIIAILVVLGVLSGSFAWRHRRELMEFVSRERYAIIVGEAIFLVFFIGWAIFRAYDPGIDHTEQPMDLGLLNASINSTFGTPEDPWLSGESVSYYYFGYWMMGAVSQITGVTAAVSYNLAMALIPALAGAAVFGLAYNIVRGQGARMRYALISGVAGAVFLGVAANLEGVLELIRANGMGSTAAWDWLEIKGLEGADPSRSDGWRPLDFWWWFRATRVINTFEPASEWIDFTIQEFPFFSFMLGDMHPHLMSIPWVLLFLTATWNWLRSPDLGWLRLGVHGYAGILFLALALGGLAFTNLWDLPTFAIVFLAVAILKTYGLHGGGSWTLLKGAVPVAVVVVGLAVALFVPYYNNASGSVTGLDPVVAATTSPVHLFLFWALFLVAVVPFIVATFWQSPVRKDWPRTAFFGLFVGALPYLAWAYLYLQTGGTTGVLWGRFIEVLPFILLIGAAIYTALSVMKDEGQTGKAFVLALAAIGLLLIMGPELVLVDDFFDVPNDRMNSVFKFYYQAWILLAVVSAFAVYHWGSLSRVVTGWKAGLTTVWASVFVVILLASLYYPPAAAASKSADAGGGATLDGLAYLNSSRPAEYDAVQFLRDNADSDSAIVEAVGEWFDQGLISRSTGIPTVFNWPGHEIQWRGSDEKFRGREHDISLIYQSQSAEETRALLDKYDVEYVYVGPREIEKYGTDGLDKFAGFMETVFSRDDVVIYRLAR